MNLIEDENVLSKIMTKNYFYTSKPFFLKIFFFNKDLFIFASLK